MYYPRGGSGDYINIRKKLRIKNMTGHTEGYSVIRKSMIYSNETIKY